LTLDISGSILQNFCVPCFTILASKAKVFLP
jgi:hypothetical protein